MFGVARNGQMKAPQGLRPSAKSRRKRGHRKTALHRRIARARRWKSAAPMTQKSRVSRSECIEAVGFRIREDAGRRNRARPVAGCFQRFGGMAIVYSDDPLRLDDPAAPE